MALPIGVNLRLAGRLKPQLYKRNPPARVTLREGFAYKILDISLVRAGGLGFYSRELHSPGLKLTPMGNAMPLQMTASNREGL